MPPSQILPNVWLGDIQVAQDAQFFKDNNITVVINCTRDIPNYFEDNPNVAYVRIPVDDNDTNNSVMYGHIRLLLPRLVSSHISQDYNILIHCYAGISRSCTVAACFLRYQNYNTLAGAVAHVQRCRPIAFFNGTHFIFGKTMTRLFDK